MKLNAITLAVLGSISTFTLAQVAPIGSGPVLTGPQGYIGLPNAPHIPATKADPAFPVQAYIVDTQWEMGSDGPHGQGRGNLLNDKKTGFEFTYSCNQPFLSNQRTEFYQARWSKVTDKVTEMEILTQRSGDSHVSKCTLQVALQPKLYIVVPASPAMAITGSLPAVASPDAPKPGEPDQVRPFLAHPVITPDPNYPVQAQINIAHWLNRVHGAGVFSVSGRGTLLNDQQADFDYKGDCDNPVAHNYSVTEFYQARWKKPGSELELLTLAARDKKPKTCTLKVSLQSKPSTLVASSAVMPAVTPAAVDAAHAETKLRNVNGQDTIAPSWVYHPVTAPNPDYPVQVHILVSHWLAIDTLSGNSGIGNLLNDQKSGFDYTDNYDHSFVYNVQPVEFYQGRWKKPGSELEILTQAIGNNIPAKCTLKVKLQSQPYAITQTTMTASASLPGTGSTNVEVLRQNQGMMQSAAPRGLGVATQSASLEAPRAPGRIAMGTAPVVPIVFSGGAGPAIQPNPQYPLHINLLASQAVALGSAFVGQGIVGYRGGGHGNLLNNKQTGFQFMSDCDPPLIANTPAGFYQARWTKSGAEMELLIQPDAKHVATCKIKVRLLPKPFPMDTTMVVSPTR